MIIHPFLSKRVGNFQVAVPDKDGFVTIHRFKTLKGAQAHAARNNGVVQGIQRPVNKEWRIAK